MRTDLTADVLISGSVDRTAGLGLSVIALGRMSAYNPPLAVGDANQGDFDCLESCG